MSKLPINEIFNAIAAAAIAQGAQAEVVVDERIETKVERIETKTPCYETFTMKKHVKERETKIPHATYNLNINGRNVTSFIDYRSRGYTRNGYHLIIGQYTDRKTYPQKADGSFSYEKIANRLIAVVATAKRSEDRRKLYVRNVNTLSKLKEELELTNWRVSLSTDIHNPRDNLFDVNVKLSAQSPAEIRHLVAALRAAGFTL